MDPSWFDHLEYYPTVWATSSEEGLGPAVDLHSRPDSTCKELQDLTDTSQT